jgi:hypothetical protein
MNDTVSNVKSRNILVLGTGELGMPVLRNLARRAKGIDGAKISVLLRESAVESGDPSKQRDIAGITEAGEAGREPMELNWSRATARTSAICSDLPLRASARRAGDYP